MQTYGTEETFWREANYDYDDVVQQRQWWNKQITELAMKMPNGPWTKALIPGGKGSSRLHVVSTDEEG